jgi:DNA (cytosine-5)-methyltransferase 1
MTKASHITVTDQFCGAGGSSIGADDLGLEVRLAMNHWPLAIETHNTNFPDTHHDCADVSNTDPRRYFSTDILITSPECTNHSVAKGVKRRQRQMHLWEKAPVDTSAERSRATMWDVVRFAEFHRYNVIVTENVVDARHWLLWDSWIGAMGALGYAHHVVYLNSMFAHLDPAAVHSLHDFAPQSRDRMYVVFWRKGNKAPNLEFSPKAHCPKCGEVDAQQTWKNTPTVRAAGGRWGRYGAQYTYTCPKCRMGITPYYFAALNAIDWSLPIPRIGDRDKPLKERTLKRIEAGLEKFGRQYLLVGRQGQVQVMAPAMLMETAYSHAQNNRSRGVDGPMFTQTGSGAAGLVMAPTEAEVTADSLGMAYPSAFFSYLYSPGYNETAAKPMAAVTAEGKHHGLVIPPAFLSLQYSPGYSKGVGESLGAVTAQDHHALVMATPALAMPQEAPRVEDCGFRILQPHEIGKGMAFPEEYVVLGNQQQKVKQYGNAVTPPAMKAILSRCVESLS